MEGMKDQKYSRLGSRDERLEILKVRGKCCKIRNTEGQKECMEEQIYPRLGVKDEGLEIHKV